MQRFNNYSNITYNEKSLNLLENKAVNNNTHATNEHFSICPWKLLVNKFINP